MTGRRGRKLKQLHDGLKEETGCWKLKQEALYRSLLSTGFGSGCGPIGRQAKGRMAVDGKRRVHVIILGM